MNNVHLLAVVGPDRADKLIGAIIKTANKEAGVVVSRAAFDMPLESDEQSKGFMFVTLNSVPEAVAFQRALHDYKFDKRHTFRVVLLSDVDKYEQLEETYAEPPKEEWKPRVRSAFPSALATRACCSDCRRVC